MAITTPTRKPTMATRSKASAKRPNKRDKKSSYKTKIKAQPSKLTKQSIKASKKPTKQKGSKEEDVQPADSSNVIVIDDDDDDIEDDNKMCAYRMKKAAADTEDDLCKGEDVFYDTLGYLPKPINDVAEDGVSKEEDVEMRGLEPEGISFSTFSTPVAKEEHSGWNLFKLFTSNSQPKQEP